jgi:predicted phosphate transport protein (TIGR00153 family)
MRTIAQVFGRSPFIPLQSHMEKVRECVDLVPSVVTAFIAGDSDRVGELAEKISKLEHEADLVKHDIRDSLPRSLFLPVHRSSLLKVLAIQDGIANRAENIAVLLTFKTVRPVDAISRLVETFVEKNLEAFSGASLIIGQLDELLETGFGGTEATKVREMVDGVSKLEYDADLLQRALLRELFSHEDELSYGDFFLWTRIVRQISQIGDRSENLATGVRTMLETK